MTHHLDTARGREIVARFCSLAEQRLEYLTELFETGRWRRFHSELAFLENIREAKSAVEIWRGLSSREASRDNSAVDMSWLGRTGPPLRDRALEPVHRPQPRPAEIAAEPAPSAVSIVPATDDLGPGDAPAAPKAEDEAPELTREIAAAVAERYPQLRNAL